MLSAGVFLKEITDFIFTDSSQTVPSGPDNGFDGHYEGFTLQTQANGGRARVRGFEVAYQQQFTFLPGWWNGFGAYANYTWLETQGDYGSSTVRSTDEVAGFRPETANIGISYIRGGHSVRLQLNYIGEFLQSFSSNQAQLQYEVAKPQLDVKTAFRINKHFDAYIDVWNLLSNPVARRVFYGERPRNMSKMRYMIHAGVRVRL
jgi:TonB-dependent receptor